MDYRIYLSPPKKGEYDIDYINKAINDITIHPNEGSTSEFERSIEDYLGHSNIKNHLL
jgi:dTDP-4-amino-4,6-dideoxygalactose transaminase